MEGGSSNEISSAEAIFVGALSSGVNAPTWFLAETGLVPVEQQIKEMGIHKTEAAEKNKGI